MSRTKNIFFKLFLNVYFLFLLYTIMLENIHFDEFLQRAAVNWLCSMNMCFILSEHSPN